VEALRNAPIFVVSSSYSGYFFVPRNIMCSKK
jgi:hypothetical protein